MVCGKRQHLLLHKRYEQEICIQRHIIGTRRWRKFGHTDIGKYWNYIRQKNRIEKDKERIKREREREREQKRYIGKETKIMCNRGLREMYKKQIEIMLAMMSHRYLPCVPNFGVMVNNDATSKCPESGCLVFTFRLPACHWPDRGAVASWYPTRQFRRQAKWPAPNVTTALCCVAHANCSCDDVRCTWV